MATKLDLSDLPAGISYVSRDEWGLDDIEAQRRGMNVQPDGLAEGYWHHTAGSSPSLTAVIWDDNPISYIRHMDDMATSGALNDTYRAVGYSWVFHKAPRQKVTIIEARGDLYPGATRGRNAVSKALCFIGNFDTRTGPASRSPRKIELDAARWLRHALVRAGVLTPDNVFRGHHENPSCPGCSTCPGNLLYPHLPYLDTPFVPVEPKPEPTPEPTPTEGLLPEMYEFQYQKTGWPGGLRLRVEADRITHIVNGPAADVDRAAGVPAIDKGKRAQLVALLSDPTRTHVGDNPFAGDYADDELSKLW